MDSVHDAGTDWVRHMRAGHWDAAWAISDAVLRARGGTRDWTRPRHEQAVWDGTPLSGRRVLVRCYHGLGDTLQFARFLPQLRAIAAAVTVWAQPALLPLLRTLRADVAWLPLHEGTPDENYDVDIEIMELAHAFRVTPATLPAAIPYLHPLVRAVARTAPGERAVGVVWAAGDWDPRRSVPPALLMSLARVPGVALHVLQRGPARAGWPAGIGQDSGSDSVLELASTMRGLDLVISVDSMPAHLAGALGLPVWTLLHADADWRWMEGRADTPWYPTMRLFRQRSPREWSDAVADIAALLASFVRARPS